MSCSIRTVAIAAAIAASITAGGRAAGPQQRPDTPPKPPSQGQASQGQPQEQDAQKPTFKAGINFVRVDVIVSDKSGNPVGDLQQNDFDVTEDGKPQTIESFKLVKLDGGTSAAVKEPPRAIHSDFDEEEEASKEDVRLFGIFLDDYHVRRGTSMGVRDPITRFLQTQIGPSDMVGVMYPLQPTAQVRFTRNIDNVEKAIQQFVGRKFDYQPRNEFEEQYANYPVETVERIRNQVSLSAIKALVTHMGSLKEGRKALIVVTEGYSNTVPPQMRDPIASMPGLDNPDRYNPTAGENSTNEDRYTFFANQDLEMDLREVYDAANKNNTALYMVDPRGLAVNEFDINEGVGQTLDRQYLSNTQNTLRELAEQTDGRAIVNRNDLEKGMKQIVRDSSAYYLIGYNSSQAPSDGKFHEIKVHVKRPGVQVRARKGYWALTAEETKTALAGPKPGPPPAVEAALSAIQQPVHGRVVRTWIGTARGDNGKTRVTFVWEPIAKTASDRARSGDAPQRVALTAASEQGNPYFRGRVPDVAIASARPGVDAPASDGNGSGSAPAHPSRVTFDVPPGKLQLRVSVEGAGAQVLDSEVRDISVPDMTAQVALGTPEVLRARTVRELQQIKADPNAVPTANREFSRTDRLLIRIPAYGPGGTTPAVTARLLNRAGKPMSDLPVAASGSSDAVAIDLPLASLAVGEYLVEVKAAGDGADTSALVGFRVTG